MVIEEAKVGGLIAMLLCLDLDHRMAFVLGEVVNADVLRLSRDDFRQCLTSAREHLRQLLTGR